MSIKLFCLLIFYSIFLIIKSEDYKSFIAKLDLNLEEVQVTTEDRYINTIWILTSNNQYNRNGKSIILQHGLLDGGFTFLVLEQNSLAKKLCEEGYTVYLPYIRGTQFSRSHLDYDSSLNSEYWDFSFDQMAKYDLPAIINYVKKRDGVEKVIFLGHSQGNFIFFLAYMNDPEFLEKNIEKFVSLGTIPNVNNAPHLLIKLFEKSHILDLIPVKNFLTFPTEIGPILVKLCTSKAQALCNKILLFCFAGFKDTGRIDYERLDKNIFLYEPGGTSLRNMKHWIQVYKAKKVQKYDFGTTENLIHYGTINPPAYDLTKMKKYSIPSLMTISDSDPFADPQDTLDFIDIIENKDVVEILRLENYNHIDYTWSDSAVEEVFPKVFNFIKE